MQAKRLHPLTPFRRTDRPSPEQSVVSLWMRTVLVPTWTRVPSSTRITFAIGQYQVPAAAVAVTASTATASASPRLTPAE